MSLKIRLMLTILVLPLLLLAGTLVASLAQQKATHEALLRERLTDAAALLAPPLGEALQAGDVAHLEDVATRLLRLDEVHALGLLDDRGETRLELGHLRALPPAPRDAATHLESDGTRWRLQTPLPGDQPAWLVLDVDAGSLLLAHYRRMGIAGVLLTVAGFGLLLVASATLRRLRRPLADADTALGRLARGGTPAPLPPSPPELAGLTERVNAVANHLAQVRIEMQRQVEQATAELQESMETIEVQNIDLDMAHRRAVEANRVKSEFLANMSHEIRTPLNGIVGFCRLLGRSSLDPRQREWLDHVQRACNNLLMLVNDVLDFSKLEAGRLELEQRPVDMVALVDEVLGLQAPQAHQKELQLLGLVYDDVPASLTGDPLRIRQILTNLVNNAVKFTEHGEVIVRVMVDQAEPGRVTLRVSVTDTGIGLSPERQRRLFHAFQQAEPSHSREFGGTGLGLTICRQLVEQMGGKIGVESTPGSGSSFAFTLPLEGSEEERRPELSLAGERVLIEEPHPATHRAMRHLFGRWGAQPVDGPLDNAPGRGPALLVASLPAAPLAPAEMQAWQQRLDDLGCPALLLVNASPLDLPSLSLPHGGEILSKPLSRTTLVQAVRQWLGPATLIPTSEGTEPAAPSPVKLLAVDDTESNRLLLRELIRRPGIEVDLAASGEEALGIARGQHYDLVLMDIRMPGMDGIETTRALRRLDDTWARTPIVAVTAHVLEEERRRLRASGLDEVLVKPVDGDDLATLLAHHLGPGLLPPPDGGEAPDEAREEDELPTVDMALGTRLAGGREGLARELLTRLAASLPESEAAIRAALEAREDTALLDAIHALNGACRYCGAPRLGLIAETLETRLRSRGRQAVLPLLDDLFAAMAALRDWATQEETQPSSTTKAIASASSSEIDR
ncbi:ATP-binding protein [Halomonas campaniensis]|uniref:ATP-binding protein n=1 Tax=Halomonas campaniensis TaxID=213554 RepID=UPI003970B9D4